MRVWATRYTTLLACNVEDCYTEKNDEVSQASALEYTCNKTERYLLGDGLYVDKGSSKNENAYWGGGLRWLDREVQ